MKNLRMIYICIFSAVLVCCQPKEFEIVQGTFQEIKVSKGYKGGARRYFLLLNEYDNQLLLSNDSRYGNIVKQLRRVNKGDSLELVIEKGSKNQNKTIICYGIIYRSEIIYSNSTTIKKIIKTQE